METSAIFKYIKSIIIAVLIASAFYFIGGDQLQYSIIQNDMPTAERLLVEPGKGTVVEQSFRSNMDEIQSFTFQPSSLDRENHGMVDIFLVDERGNIVTATSAKAEDCVDYMPYVMSLMENTIVEPGSNYTLRIVFNGETGKNPTLYYRSNGNSKLELGSLTVNGELIEGVLCLGASGIRANLFGTYYWYFVAGIIGLILIYMAWSEHQSKQGKFTAYTLFITIWKKYRFLIEQLVGRDFKVKYKRSVLGYCWSFLNPLLTMLVQYFVFSTIFKTGIENYPVYLLSGNIMFSFFTEAVGQGLMSIIGNASLITKVYVPKYIYPATKVLSSSINLFISVVPLLFVTLLTGGTINLTLLLLPYALMCLLIFCLGMVLLLSAANVFFRDVQYLWGIISLVWMYATPIFYPANIIPEKLRFIQTWNPMYHIIAFTRSILIDGVSPSPDVYLSCLIGAGVSLTIGVAVFKKTQGKFALYI